MHAHHPKQSPKLRKTQQCRQSYSLYHLSTILISKAQQPMHKWEHIRAREIAFAEDIPVRARILDFEEVFEGAGVV